jgi:hypothetical protein
MRHHEAVDKLLAPFRVFSWIFLVERKHKNQIGKLQLVAKVISEMPDDLNWRK